MKKTKNNVIESVAKQSLAFLTAAGLAFGLAACSNDESSSTGPNGDDEISSSSEEVLSSSSEGIQSSSSVQNLSSSSEAAKKEPKYIGVVFDGGDYNVPEGELRLIDKSGKISEKSLSIYQDSRVTTYGDYVFFMEGLGTDVVYKINPDLFDKGAEKAIVWSKKLESGTNPIDMSFDSEKAWVALQNADSLVQLSLTDGKLLKTIKTGDFASEGETTPYVTDIEVSDGKLYVLMQRYINTWPVTYPKGLLAIYDASTGALQDTIQLATKNPQKMAFVKGTLYVATLGEYNDTYGTDADANRGIEKVDVKAKKSALYISGAILGSGLSALVAEDDVAYVGLYKYYGSTLLAKVDLEKKTVTEVKGISDIGWSIALKNGVVYVGERASGKETVYSYKDGKLTEVKQPKGAQAPYSIALF